LGVYSAAHRDVGMILEGTFDVVGAKNALALFGGLRAGALSHGYLFTGMAGVGKKTFARCFARSLLCEKPKVGLLGYDDTCGACKLLRAGTHPDYFEAQGTIKIGRDAGSARQDEQMTARDLVRELSLRGYAGKYRVVVLGDVEFATHEAANALLKFFEEPPADVVVLLTTSTSGTLLPTIRSRFVEVPFAPLLLEEIVVLLTRDGVEAAAAQRAASIAQGSIIRARAVLEGEESGMRAAAMMWLEEALHGRAHDLHLEEQGTTATERRAYLASFLETVRFMVRDWAVLSLVGEEAPLLNTDLRARFLGLPQRDARQVLTLLTAAAEAERMAGTNVTPGLTAEYLRMQCAS
jgi:DNA polymerase III subunit delta'